MKDECGEEKKNTTPNGIDNNSKESPIFEKCEISGFIDTVDEES